MSVNVIREHIDSREYSYNAGKVTATRTFKVYSSLGGITTPATIRSLFGTATLPDAMPDIGELFPSETDIKATSYSIKKDAESSVWTVVWNYSNSEIDPGDKQPSEPGYVEWTLDVNASFADTYVDKPVYPRYGTISAIEDANEIGLAEGGKQVDLEGVPVSALRLTTDISISETVESYGGPPAVYAASRVARGSRNGTLWYGIAIGKALYMGCNCKRIGINLYSVTHRIQEATDFHLIQYPERDSVGRVPTALKNGKKRARRVFWKQPFPTFADFDAISPNW